MEGEQTFWADEEEGELMRGEGRLRGKGEGEDKEEELWEDGRTIKKKSGEGGRMFDVELVEEEVVKECNLEEIPSKD